MKGEKEKKKGRTVLGLLREDESMCFLGFVYGNIFPP